MKLAALALLLAAVAAPAHAQTPAIWSLSDDDTTIYLFGTVHSLDEGPGWFAGDIAAAYQESAEVVLETLITDTETTRQSGLKYAASDRRLRDLLPKSKVKAFEAALAKAGAKKSALDGYDPWFANIIVGTVALKDSPLRSDHSVESALRDAAQRDGKKLISLETQDEQFAAYDSIPLAAQVKHLVATLDQPDRVAAAAEQTVQCWKTGDLACVKAASDRELGMFPEVRDALLVRRNARWAEWIAERMERPGTVMLAVGIEHFVGEGSLPGVLDARGLRVKRLGLPS